jgi:ElaB/YqjD/DUF883 family membrane-anchored ribosome-binding protein
MTATNPTPRHDAAAGNGTEHFNTTTAKVASAAHTAVDIAAENLAQAEMALREARMKAGEKVSETAEHAKSYSEDAVATVKAYVNLYPLRSLGMALAAGYLLSSLIKR